MLQKIISSLLIMSFFTGSCQNLGEESIYLIPKGFEGNVLIVFDQADGADVSYENGKRVYRLNMTGVLKTKFKSNYGVSRNFYYLVDTTGKRNELRYLDPVARQSLKDSSTVICVNHTVGNGYDQQKAVQRHFEMFTITTLKHADSIGNQKDNFMAENLDGK